MFDLMKPGHVLRFGVCPSTLISPPAENEQYNDNTLATHWPNTQDLGVVQCISHPSGPIGPIAADVALKLRPLANKSRSASYSPVGQFFTKSNRVVGAESSDFVGYTDGKSLYIQSAKTVFSKDFSGCLMVAYKVGGQRHVAHVAASKVKNLDCKQAFLDKFRTMPGDLIGWFRPYVEALDFDRKIASYHLTKQYLADIYALTTFGVVSATGQGYSINAFKPKGIPGNDWIVTEIRRKLFSQDLHV